MLKYEDMLCSTSDICAELDRYEPCLCGVWKEIVADMISLLALAQGAKLYKYSRPRITRRNIIEIKGGR